MTKGKKKEQTDPKKPKSRTENLKNKNRQGHIPKAERLFRFRIVEACLRDGKRGAEIVEELQAHGRKVVWSQVSEYIADVKYKWEQEDAQLRPIWRERQLRKLHEVALKLEAPKTWGHWIRLQELIAKIEGNMAPEKVDVTTRTDEFEGWTVEELRQYVETDGRQIPIRFKPAQASTGDSEGVPWDGGEGTAGNTAGTLH